MSSGGQAGIDLSGITSLRIQNASDVTTQLRYKLVTLDFSSNVTKIVNHNYNSDQYFRQFLNGKKECPGCSGLPYTIF
jgi:hypothetical protein